MRKILLFQESAWFIFGYPMKDMNIAAGRTHRLMLVSTALLLCLAFLTGCSSFNRDWRRSGKAPASADPIEGRWQGTWKSDASAHSDKLRCLLTRLSDGKYEARFHAKYKKILSFSYTATFAGSKTNDVFSFSGEADLGKLAGGIYHYQGQITPANFFSTYTSKYDHGTFQLVRPTK